MPADAGGGLVPEHAARIVLRPAASSLPLGLTLLSAAWAATAVTIADGPPGARSVPLAIFLRTLAVMMLAMFGASLSAKPLFGLLLAGPARTAPAGGLDQQVEGAEAEPGIRRRL